jgi:hypothetical protein
LHAHPQEIAYDYEVMVTDVTNAQFAIYLNEALAAGNLQRSDNEIVGFYPGDEFKGYKHEESIEAGDWLHVPLGEAGLRLVGRL